MTTKVQGRWYWNATRTAIVPEGDTDAAFLAYPHGEEIPDEEAKMVGLSAKMQRPTGDKMDKDLKNK